MDGILPLWKPKGLTSHDCVIKIRRLFNTKKVGHTGTLDPEVEGVLPICVGQATKIVPYLTDTKKTYIAEVRLGVATDTEDQTGKIVEEKAVVQMPSNEEIDRALDAFRGEISQIPPMYSAVKVKGKKLYEYARANQTVERPKRKVTIHLIKQLQREVNVNSFWIKVVCSKGTYIRTLCVDIGKKLGYPAHMKALTRTATGSISQEECVTFDQMTSIEIKERKNFLLPVDKGLDHLDKIVVNQEMKNKIVHGQKLPQPENVPKTDPFVFMHEGELLAIYQIDPKRDQQIKAVRVFNR
jgi:tRNA pseudouridine55 synthase